MKRKYLRDALDSFKSEVLSRAFPDGRLRAVPLWTSGRWTVDERRLYAQVVLGAPDLEGTHVFVKPFPQAGPARDRYLDGVRSWMAECDLFLDPDTGVRADAGMPTTRPNRFLRLSELSGLLAGGRVVAIYQHRAAFKVPGSGRLKDSAYLEPILEAMQGWHRVAIYGGNVSIVFASKTRGRIDEIRKRLMQFAGPSSMRVLPRSTV